MFKFTGRKEREAYHRAIEEVGLDKLISPGGASMLLGLSRQRIWQLVDTPAVRCWAYYEGLFTPTLQSADISVVDLIRHGLKTGKFQSADDVALKFPALQQTIDDVKRELVE